MRSIAFHYTHDLSQNCRRSAWDCYHKTECAWNSKDLERPGDDTLVPIVSRVLSMFGQDSISDEQFQAIWSLKTSPTSPATGTAELSDDTGHDEDGPTTSQIQKVELVVSPIQ